MVTAGIKLSLDTGDAVSAAGRYAGALHNLNGEIQKAEQLAKKTGKSEDWEKYARLTIDRDRMQNSSTSFDKNIKAMTNNPRFQTQGPNGQTVFKADPEFVSIMKTHVDAIKKLTAAYEVAAPGSDEASDLAFQIENQQKAFSKAIEDATGAGRGKQGGGTENTVKAIGIGQIANAISQGFSQWAASRDRTASISAYGSGDLMGGQLAEMQRRANFWSGITRIGSVIVGTGLGALVGNPIAGGMIGGAAGNAVAAIIEGSNSEERNRVAYANLWAQRTEDSMNLAAIMGRPGDVRGSFDLAASVSEKYGFSAEAGSEALKAAARQGLGGEAAREVTEQVFTHERGTGADRNSLLSLAAMSARFGTGDALKNGWAGLQASSMKTGQYNEYLRAMERVMAEGISKGFKLSSEQAVQNLTMLSRMTGGDPLWTGEQGANRLMKMNAGLENATGLQSATDVLAYRAAKSDKDRDYTDTMITMEKGLTPELFRNFMDLTKSIEGGDRAAIIERIRQAFGLNYTTSAQLYSSWELGKMPSETELNVMLGRQMPLPNSDSPELGAAVTTATAVNEMTRLGQVYWDQKLPELTDILHGIRNDLAAARGEAGAPSPVITADMPPEVAVQTRHQQRAAMDDQFERMDAATRDYFSGGREDRTARGAIHDTLRTAIYSEDNDQIAMARDFFNLLESVPRNTRQEWDSNNSLNSLVVAGNMERLLSLLQGLLDATRETRDAVREGSEINLNVY
jgi:hypothetical protein